MKTIMVLRRLLSRSRLSNIFIIAELCLCFFFLTTMVNAFTDAFSVYSLFQKMNISKSIYFMGNIPIWVEDEKNGDVSVQYAVDFTDEIHTYLEKQPEWEGNSKLIYAGIDLQGLVQENRTKDLYAYDQKTAAYFDSVWHLNDLFETTPSPGVIPCVVLDNTAAAAAFQKGDTFTTTIQILNARTGKITDKSITLQVIRVIANSPFPAFYPTALMTGMSINATDLFAEESDYTFFVPYSQEVFGEGESNTSLVYLDPATTPARLQEIQGTLNRYGYSNTFGQIIEQTKQSAFEKLKTNASLFVALTGMLMISLISLAYLSAERTFKRFSIYHLVGCPARKSRRYYFLSLLTLLLGSFVTYQGLAWAFRIYYAGLSVRDRSFRLQTLNTILGGNVTATLAIALLCAAVVALSTLIQTALMRGHQSTVSQYKKRK